MRKEPYAKSTAKSRDKSTPQTQNAARVQKKHSVESEEHEKETYKERHVKSIDKTFPDSRVGSIVQNKHQPVKIVNKVEKCNVSSKIDKRGITRPLKQQNASKPQTFSKGPTQDAKRSPRQGGQNQLRSRPSRTQSLDRQSRQRDKLLGTYGAPIRTRSKSHDPTRSRSRSRSRSQVKPETSDRPEIAKIKPNRLEVRDADTRPSRERTKIQTQHSDNSPAKQRQRDKSYPTGNKDSSTKSSSSGSEREDRTNLYYANLSPVPESAPRPLSANDQRGQNPSELDSEGTTSTRRFLHKHIPRTPRQTKKAATSHEIQQLVRIFELKTGASSGIHRSRKINMYNRSKGTNTEKKIVAQLKNDLASRSANLKTEDDFKSSNEWELYLQGKHRIQFSLFCFYAFFKN